MIFLSLLACSEFDLNNLGKPQTTTPSIVVSPAEYNYGEQPFGSSIAHFFEIENIGTEHLNITDIAIEGSGQFVLLSLQSEHTLPPFEQKIIEVLYTSNGTPQHATIKIESNDPYEPKLSVPISGTTPQGAIILEPNPVDFGYTPRDTTVSEFITIRNIGSDVVDLQTLFINETVFTADESNLPFALAPNESQQLEVTFSPDTEDRFTGSVWFQSSLGSHLVTMTGTSEEPIEEEPEDPCLDPDLSFEQHPQAKLFVADSTSPITVTYVGTDAGYTNELWLLYPFEQHLATGHQTPENTVVDLGTFVAGQELFFQLYVRDTGHYYYSGPPDRNPDNKTHAAISYLGDCQWLVGFEDMYNGGDQDFDDILMILSGELQLQL